MKMRWVLFGALAFSAFSSLSLAEETVDMLSPPFWMSSYDEFSDLPQMKKDLYVQKLEHMLPTLPTLKQVSSAELKDAAEWFKSWESIRKRLYTYCAKKDEATQSQCEQIAEIRLQILDANADRKHGSNEAELKDLPEDLE